MNFSARRNGLFDLRTVEACVFDFFGTLADVDVDLPDMWEYLNTIGYRCPLSLQQVWESDAFDGMTTPTFDDSSSYQVWRRTNVAAMATLSGVPADSLDSVVSELLDRDTRWTVKSIHGASRVVDQLKALHLKVGLCTNWDYPLEKYLAQANLAGFDAVTVSAVVGARKPHIIPINDVIKKLQVEPSKALFVGDRWSTDIVGSIRAGFHPVWIRNASIQPELAEIVTQFTSLSEFARWVAEQA
jgi:FMN phosphatase YigB (HAD superfamily)